MRFFERGLEKKTIDLSAADFVSYMLNGFHIMECLNDNLTEVCEYFDKVAKENDKSLMIPDSLYLDMMIDISEGRLFCFTFEGFDFLYH